MITDDIRREVHQACAEPANVLTGAFYDEHLRLVVHYATALAPRLGADAETVELAALLHDISAVQDITTLPQHASASADLGRSLLLERGYPPARADTVAAAILRHSSPVAVGAATPEEVCLSNADAMAQIAAPAYWLYFAYRVRQLGYEDGKRWYTERVRQNWEALVPEARQLVEERYAQVAAALEAALG